MTRFWNVLPGQPEILCGILEIALSVQWERHVVTVFESLLIYYRFPRRSN
jgi:hypothetical protein